MDGMKDKTAEVNQLTQDFRQSLDSWHMSEWGPLKYHRQTMANGLVHRQLYLEIGTYVISIGLLRNV